MDKQYIERGALMKKIFPLGDIVDSNSYSINAKAIQKAIQETPAADVVEVVRCEDCVYWYGIGSTGVCEAPVNGVINAFKNSDDFCSYGERKSEK